MKKLALISLLFINSCTNKVDLRGDWKAIEFMNNGVINRDFNFPITYIKSDNIIIYFDDVMFYEIKGDSMLFMVEDDLDKVISKKKIEILDENTFMFYYDRKMIDEKTDSIKTIPYHTKWKRI